MILKRETLTNALIVVAAESGAVANYCDHAEHNEPVDLGDVRHAGLMLRETGVSLSEAADRNPVELFRRRLKQIEERNVLFEPDGFDGAAAVSPAPSWRDLQSVQIAHDRHYHPDVLGLHKLDQLRHYTLHLAKLAGATGMVLIGEGSEDDFIARRVPDLIIFGVKLSTVTGERLSAEAFVARAETTASAGR